MKSKGSNRRKSIRDAAEIVAKWLSAIAIRVSQALCEAAKLQITKIRFGRDGWVGHVDDGRMS